MDDDFDREMTTRRRFCGAVAGLGAAVVGNAALAQAPFPSKPIRLLVPYAAGGGTDAIARLVAQGLSERLKQTVLIENNGAAGGNVATQQAAAAAPDGYTMLMANQGPMVVNPHLLKSTRVDPLTAFDPLTLITEVPLLVVVRKDSPFTSLGQLVQAAQASPGKLTYGSAGRGSASHLATVLLAQMAKLEMVHVPYRGAAPALTDVLGGRMDFMVTTLPSVLGQVQSGDVIALAVTTGVRSPLFPDVPTVAELGWPGYLASAWYGFVVPRGTPAAVADVLRTATIETIGTPAMRARLLAEGGDAIGNTAEAFAAMMKSESARWAGIIRQGGITAE